MNGLQMTRMRILVAIANHGTKNQNYLVRLLESYRGMSYDVDLVVLSDRPKELGDDVEVRVGAPTSDPWSLPFAHRPLFAERIDDYDLFIYTEDDTLVLEQHIDAFLAANALLPEDQIPGFQRFELSQSGERSISSIHSTYRWVPDTVAIHDGEVFAAHTNLHAAFYILTQDQLRQAIASGGFLVEPHADLFDMLVSAAIDPYAQCGLERRLCVSRIEDFLVHHLPSVYVGEYGASSEEFDAQVDAILKLAVGELSREQLLEPRSKLPTHVWDVIQYPAPDPVLLELASGRGGRVLSVGATSGAAELAAFPKAVRIDAIPVDAIIGSVAAMRGLNVLKPTLDEIERRLAEERYDIFLLHHNLQHVPHPASLLERLRAIAAPEAVVLVGMQNASNHQLRALIRRRHAPAIPHRGFDVDGIHRPGLGLLRRLERQRVIRWRDVRVTRSDRLARIPGWLPTRVEAVFGREVYAIGEFPT